MERLPNETLENAISVYKTTIEATKDIDDEDYNPFLDKVTVSFLEELKAYRDAEEQGLLLRLPDEMRNLDKKNINLAFLKTINLCRYGVDVDDRLTTATELSYALHDAYVRGRKDEVDRMKVVEQEIRNKVIDEFAEQLKTFKFHSTERSENCVPVCEIDWLAEQMKGE